MDIVKRYALWVITSLSISAIGLVLTLEHVRHTIWLLGIGILMFFGFTLIMIYQRNDEIQKSNGVNQE